MSMLAGPRQKKEYRLLPKGKPLYEDESNFGTRMLQKMGWSKGKGLGANEDGNQEFIRVKYKDDANGLGFKDRDDGWTQHKTEFETLLKSLNNSLENSDEEHNLSAAVGFGFQNGSSKKEESTVPKLSGESLEEKSKKSRARVHYKKFTRGKDLSQYSEKDLANIFGKKTLDISKEEPRQLEEVVEERACKEERVFGVQVISTGTSINDYFKNKMALLKSGRKQDDACGENQNSFEDSSLGNQELVPENLSSKKKKESITEIVANEGTNYTQTDEVQKIKKKKKKQHLEAEIIPMDINGDEDNSKEVPSKKKKKNFDEKSNTLENINNQVIEEIVEKKSKKKNKNISNTEVESINASESIEDNDANKETFKKKSKKNKSHLDEVTSHQVVVEASNAMEPSKNNEANEEIEKKSKNKKRKLDNEGVKAESCEIQESNNTFENESNKKKKPSDEAEPVPSKNKKSKQENQLTTEKASNVEECKTQIELPSNNINYIFEQPYTSENISISNNLKNTKKPKKNKKRKKEHKESDVLQSNSEIENIKPTSTVSENEISSTSPCTYKINSFIAEVFRHTDIDGFVGSNLSKIVGYTLSEDVALEVIKTKTDEGQIYNLWNDAINKKQQFQKWQRLQSEKGQGEKAESYKSKRRKRSWNKNLFRVL